MVWMRKLTHTILVGVELLLALAFCLFLLVSHRPNYEGSSEPFCHRLVLCLRLSIEKRP
jgi:hypothetical protein